MSEAAPSRILLSGYFFRARDPQRRRRYRPDDDRLLERWLPGVRSLGLDARIFHDGLSEPFVQRHSTGKVGFIHSAIPRGVSCNDQRFFLYRKWLLAHPEVQSAFCTDLFDVRVVRDPHALCDGRLLWVGREPWLVHERPTMQDRLRRAYGEVDPELLAQPILNAGIVGGPRAILLELLDDICAEIASLRSRGALAFNCNMAALNRVLYRPAWRARVLAPGRPLHSVFGQYEDDARDVCFVHR